MENIGKWNKRFKKIVDLNECRKFLEEIKGKIPPQKISFKDVEYFDPIILAWLELFASKNSQIILPDKDKYNNEYYKFIQLLILSQKFSLPKKKRN